MPLTIGARLGSYEIVSALGAGGMGEVYRARDTKLGRLVAIKILPEAFAQDPERVARFRREAQLLAALNHPHIAGIHGIEEAHSSTPSADTAQVTGSGQAPSASSGQGAVSFLVLEFVDGESLAEKLALGSGLQASGTAQSRQPIAHGLPVGEAVAIARQIVDALEAAHEKGIIHRDLKPANIMLTAEGQVKVLDFGLAKALGPAEAGHYDPQVGAGGFTHSPTLSMAATQAGMILGTAAYMSPEQAKGRPADKRTDVWAFGCVLFEMLAGKRAFDGEDLTDVIAAVVRGEPDWAALPADMPPHIRSILERCLVKDRKARIPDISVVRFTMDEAASAGPSARGPREESESAPAANNMDVRRGAEARGGGAPRAMSEGPGLQANAGTPASGLRATRIWQAVAVLFGLTTIAGATVAYLARSTTPAVARFFISPPEKGAFTVTGVSTAGARLGAIARISPDGRMLAFTAGDAAGKTLLWVRAIDSLTAQPLTGTDGAAWPFWSPDSRQVAYSTQGKLMKIAASGGPPQTLCALSGPTILARGGAWNRDGAIVFSNGPGPLFRVSSAGGQASPVMKLATGQSAPVFPSFLPDGRHLLFYLDAPSAEVSGIYVVSLNGGEPKRLLAADTGGIYAPESGYLLFVRQGTLLAQAFDPKTLTLADEPFPIAEGVESGAVPGVVAFSLSENGVLAYGTGSTAAAGLQMVWVDREGRSIETVGPEANYRGLDLAPDSKRVAAHRHDGTGGDIWVSEPSPGPTSRFTFDASQENSSPIWSPDGSRVVFGSLRGGKWGLHAKAANQAGNEEQLVQSDVAMLPVGWAPDGGSIVYRTFDLKTQGDLWLLPLSGDRRAIALLQTPFNETYGQVSPDGKWLAYHSNETGRNEIYVQPFPEGAGKWQVSTNGGLFPRWRCDGRELFYMDVPSNGTLMAVEVKSGGSAFERGTPQELFDSGYINLPHGSGSGTGGIAPYHTYAVSADGQRFLIPRPPASNATDAGSPPIAVVLNWEAGLKK